MKEGCFSYNVCARAQNDLLKKIGEDMATMNEKDTHQNVDRTPSQEEVNKTDPCARRIEKALANGEAYPVASSVQKKEDHHILLAHAHTFTARTSLRVWGKKKRGRLTRVWGGANF